MTQKIDDSLVLIINGENDKENMDGHVDFVGKIYYDKDIHNIKVVTNLDIYKTHIDYLLEYGKKKYPDESIFNVLTPNHFFQVVIYFLSVFNNIVYLNISVIKEHQKGLLFMPDEISEKQKESLYGLARENPDINVEILYNLTFVNGDIDLKNCDCQGEVSFEEKLNNYFALMDKINDNEKSL